MQEPPSSVFPSSVFPLSLLLLLRFLLALLLPLLAHVRAAALLALVLLSSGTLLGSDPCSLLAAIALLANKILLASAALLVLVPRASAALPVPALLFCVFGKVRVDGAGLVDAGAGCVILVARTTCVQRRAQRANQGNNNLHSSHGCFQDLYTCCDLVELHGHATPHTGASAPVLTRAIRQERFQTLHLDGCTFVSSALFLSGTYQQQVFLCKTSRTWKHNARVSQKSKRSAVRRLERVAQTVTRSLQIWPTHRHSKEGQAGQKILLSTASNSTDQKPRIGATDTAMCTCYCRQHVLDCHPFSLMCSCMRYDPGDTDRRC